MDTQTYTETELERMRAYEQTRGERVIYSFEEKCQIYQTKDKETLRNASFGIRTAIGARLNLDNADCFDGADDRWKLKTLKENLEAIERVLSE